MPILIALGVIITAIFLLDFLTPLGISISFLYVVAMLMTAWLPGFLAPIVTASLCTAFTLIVPALTASSFSGSLWMVLLNRGLTIAVVWIVAGVILNRRHAEETLISLIQGSPVGEILIDSAGSIRVMNRQAEDLFGYEVDEWAGMAVEELVPKQFRTEFRKIRTDGITAPMDRPSRHGRPLVARRKDGTGLPIEMSVTSTITPSGKGLLLSIVSVRERQVAQEQLRIHAKQQSVVADLGQFALEVSDLDDILNQAVQRMAETLEVEFGKILELSSDGKEFRLRAGVGWREGLVGDATVGAELNSQAGFTLASQGSVIVEELESESRFSGPGLLLDHGIVSGMSCVIAGRPGSRFGVLGAHTLKKRRFSDDDVHFLEAIANVVGQSVQRFNAEAERKRSEDQLRRSRDMFLNLIQNNPFGVYVVDSEFRVSQVSAGAQKVFSTINPMIGRDFAEVLRILWPEPFATQAIERFRHTLATGESYRSMDTTEERNDTTEIESYDWRIERVTLPDGLFGVVCYFYDMTERVRHEQEIHRLKNELETRVLERTHELMEKQHQLRTMATELTLTEQRERRRLATDLHDYLAQLLVVCRMKCGQLRSLVGSEPHGKILEDIDQVLDQSLTYTRSLVAELSPQVLYQFGLPKALEFLSDQMRQHGLLVKVDSTLDSLTLLEEQAVLLFQSVRELLMNVIKHAGTDRATVSLTKQINGEICIQVADEGQGFDLAAAAAGKQSISTRFGHFSIQERMKALKGRLDIDSSPGRGTCVTLALPCESPALGRPTADGQLHEADSGPLGRPQPTGRSDPSPGSRVRVLLVDDHAMVREGVRVSLESHCDFHIIGEASSGMEAIELAHVLQPDAIVMDVNMPGMNGIEATQRIMATAPSIYIIGLSVNTDAATRKAMLAAGARAFLYKDVAAVELCRVLMGVMQDRVSQP
ncbi:MAG: response regulator [Nitrospira sp.]|nr:response regulator [Nitrospira sp.]